MFVCCSLLGFFSSTMTTCMVLGLLGDAAANDRLAPTTSMWVGVHGFGVAVGIFSTSFAGQACLPVVYAQMGKPHQYERLLSVCFAIMFLVYAAMGVAGYIVYGAESEVLVTSNIATWPGGVAAWISISLVVSSCACTIAPVVAVLADPFEAKLLGRHSEGKCTSWAVRGIRTCLFGAAATFAYVMRANLGNLESLMGGVASIQTSLVLPSLFYVKMFASELSCCTKFVNYSIAVAGCLLSAFIVYSNVQDMLK